MRTGFYDQSELSEKKKHSSTTHVYSSFSFLREHNGLRPGKTHVFLAPTSGGKSTLIRSVVIDTIEHYDAGHIGVILTEESEDEFITEIMYTNYKSEKLKKLVIAHEEDDFGDYLSNPIEYIEALDSFVQKNGIKILFYDNITTSNLYLDKQVSVQSQFAKMLKHMAKRHDIALVVVAHTSSDIKENHHGLITTENVRGTRTLSNLAEFFYVMQNFKRDNDITTILRITKHRGQPVKNMMYRLSYHPKARMFFNSEKIPFSVIKEAFKGRNSL